jgi:hypothetical protein
MTPAEAKAKRQAAEARILWTCIYNRAYRGRRARQGRPIKDAYTLEKRVTYWREWSERPARGQSCTNREARNARARDRYHYLRHLEGACLILQKVLTTHPNAGRIVHMKTPTARSRVDVKEAARFLTLHAGVEVTDKALIVWARRGRVPCQQLVGKYYFDLAELAGWLEDGRVALDAARALDTMRRGVDFPKMMA